MVYKRNGGDRRAWLVPLLPFAAAPDPAATATLAEGALELANRGAPGWWSAVASKPALAVVTV